MVLIWNLVAGLMGLAKGVSNAYNYYYLATHIWKNSKIMRRQSKFLTEKVRRVLRLIFRTEMSTERPWGSMLTEEHYKVAREIGEEGIVLLKNENNTLPININEVKKIARL